MKKFILGLAALAAVAGFTACDKCGSDACQKANDSLSVAYGNYVGAMVGTDIAHYSAQSNVNKEEFVKGMQLIFGAGNSESERMGMQVAIQLLGEINRMKENGVVLDPTTVLKAYKTVFLTDSLDMAKTQGYMAKFTTMMQEAEAQAKEEAAKAKAEEPTAKENVAAGDAFVAKLLAENPAAKKAESGLVYVIQNPGVAPQPEATATVTVNYTGKLINGTVFDSSEGRGPATFNLQGVIPGFREGLMLLGKGGKATLYIPGNLAYGVEGAPQAGIGPNEMLIFEVELISFE